MSKSIRDVGALDDALNHIEGAVCALSLITEQAKFLESHMACWAAQYLSAWLSDHSHSAREAFYQDGGFAPKPNLGQIECALGDILSASLALAEIFSHTLAAGDKDAGLAIHYLACNLRHYHSKAWEAFSGEAWEAQS